MLRDGDSSFVSFITSLNRYMYIDVLYEINLMVIYTDNTWHSKEILSRVFPSKCELKRDTNINIFKNLDLQKFCSEVG